MAASDAVLTAWWTLLSDLVGSFLVLAHELTNLQPFLWWFSCARPPLSAGSERLIRLPQHDTAVRACAITALPPDRPSCVLLCDVCEQASSWLQWSSLCLAVQHLGKASAARQVIMHSPVANRRLIRFIRSQAHAAALELDPQRRR